MRIILGMITLMTFTIGTVFPQDNVEKKIRIGIGVQLLPPSEILDGDDGIFSLPIGYSIIQFTILTESIKIEPTFGIIRFQEERTGDFAFEVTNSQLRLGVGVYRINRRKNTYLYLGGHLGIIRHSESSKFNGDSNEEKLTDLTLGPVAGVEYLLNGDFSIGGEAQFKYTSIGQREGVTDRSENIISTNTSVSFRWYF